MYTVVLSLHNISSVAIMGNAQSQSPGVNIPEKMKRLVLVEPNKILKNVQIEVEEVDVPRPNPGQVLIKVAASPLILAILEFG